MRLIDADKLIEVFAVKKEVWRGNGVLPSNESLMWLAAMGITANSPTVDAAPVVHGRWIHCKGKSNLWYCSVCGEKIIYNPTRKTYKPDKKPVWEINKYCRNCSAKMDLEEQKCTSTGTEH